MKGILSILILMCLITLNGLAQFEGDEGSGYYSIVKDTTACATFYGSEGSGDNVSDILALSNCFSFTGDSMSGHFMNDTLKLATCTLFTGDSLSGYHTNHVAAVSDCQNFYGGDYSGHENDHFQNPNGTCYLFTESEQGGSGYVSDLANECFVITLGINASPLFAELVDNKNGRLYWQTFSERNNAGFDIQRSTDGYNWESIGWVEGNNNSMTTIDYEFLDENLPTSINYYRYVQHDFDGKRSYSNIVHIEIGEATTWKDVFVLYPNPTSPTTGLNLKAYVNQEWNVRFTILDMTGRSIFEDHYQFNQLQSQYVFEIFNYKAGTYVLSIIIEGQPEQVRVPFVITN